MEFSFARLLFRQPVGGRDFSIDRLRALSKLRGLVALNAIVLDLAIWALLRNDPAIDPEVLGWFVQPAGLTDHA